MLSLFKTQNAKKVEKNLLCILSSDVTDQMYGNIDQIINTKVKKEKCVKGHKGSYYMLSYPNMQIIL